MELELELDGMLGNNSTFDYGDYLYEEDCITESTLGTVFIPVLYSLVVLLGLLGHGLVLVVLWKKKRSWSVTDTFVLHLSVADLLLLLTMPLWAVQEAKEWICSLALCKLAGALFQIHFYCEIFLLACISLYCYLSIVHSMKTHLLKILFHISCPAILLFSFLLSIPDWHHLQISSNSQRGGKNECVHGYLSDERRLVLRLLYHVVGFLLPVAVLLYSYCFIFLQLQGGSQGLQKLRAVRVTLALVVAFFICWTPYNITLLVDTIQHASSDSPEPQSCQGRWTAVNITAVLGFLHCCLNPFIYFALSEKFQRWVLTLLRCGGSSLDNGDIFSLWDLEQVNKSASTSPEEKQSAHSLTDLGQSVEGQTTVTMASNGQNTEMVAFQRSDCEQR